MEVNHIIKPFSPITEAFFNSAVLLHGYWIVQYCKNEPMVKAAVLHEPMVAVLAKAHQNGQDVWLYKWPLCHRILGCTSTVATTRRTAPYHGKEHRTRSCILGNQGYDSNQVRSLSILHSYCVFYLRHIWGASTTTPCYGGGRLHPSHRCRS